MLFVAPIFSTTARLLTAERFRINSAAVRTDRARLSNILAELRRRQLSCGGWAALTSSPQASLEATCLASLAIGMDDCDSQRRAHDFLLRVQNPNGSWPVFLGDGQEGAWVTSLGVIALRDLATAIPARLAGSRWLTDCEGKESNWFWKWKFRTADRHVRFNPEKAGWRLCSVSGHGRKVRADGHRWQSHRLHWKRKSPLDHCNGQCCAVGRQVVRLYAKVHWRWAMGSRRYGGSGSLDTTPEFSPNFGDLRADWVCRDQSAQGIVSLSRRGAST